MTAPVTLSLPAGGSINGRHHSYGFPSDNPGVGIVKDLGSVRALPLALHVGRNSRLLSTLARVKESATPKRICKNNSSGTTARTRAAAELEFDRCGIFLD
jgi:hypothetical protein